MSNKFMLSNLFPDSPFFGGKTHGIQGFAIRHIFMACAIHKIAESNSEPKMLEVGSWTGSSVLTWSQAIVEFCSGGGTILCVDPWLPYFNEKDIFSNSGYQDMNDAAALDLSYNLFLHNIQFAATDVKINHFRGSSSDVLPYLAADSFDIVYLDGSHCLEDVRYDLAQADKLLKNGGILCGDDLELKGDECDLEFAREHPNSDFLADPKTGNNFHPGVTVAVHEMFPEVSSYCGFWLMQKIDGKYQTVDLVSSSFVMPSHFPEALQASILEELKAYLEQKAVPKS